jgi:hypothetical protein
MGCSCSVAFEAEATCAIVFTLRCVAIERVGGAFLYGLCLHQCPWNLFDTSPEHAAAEEAHIREGVKWSVLTNASSGSPNPLSLAGTAYTTSTSATSVMAEATRYR